jgi:hypothetical protein
VNEADRAWVEEMLSGDLDAGPGADLRAQLEFDRRIEKAFEQKVAEIPADIGWAGLLERARADSAPAQGNRRVAAGEPDGPAARPAAAGVANGPRSPARKAGPVRGREGWWQRLVQGLSPMMSPQLGMAMVVLLAVQTIAIGVLMGDRQAGPDTVEYRSGGDAKPVTAIRALLNESVTEKVLREALSANGASIVEGPNPLGEYWIVTGERDPEAVAASLRDAGVVASYVIDQRLQRR